MRRRVPPTPVAPNDPQLAALAAELDRPVDEVRAEAQAGIAEMSASHGLVAMAMWRRLGRRLLRGYELRPDTAALARLKELERDHTLVWLPSHRSYLDTWAFPQVLDDAGFPPYYVLGGINLDFWPFGDIARRTGLIFIRRDVKDDPVYRFALRRHLSHLTHHHADFGWSIEGGRTRTGKLRPPRYGLLRYVSDVALDDPDAKVLLVPVSIVYNELPEVSLMTAESRGEVKRPEDLRWLWQFARRQDRASGDVHITFGEPVLLAERLIALQDDDDGGGGHAVERVALEVCHRIEAVTPVVPTALATIALLAADRALTLGEVADAVAPVAAFAARRRALIDARLVSRRTAVAAALDELVRADAAVRYDGGREPVWAIGSEQHLTAAFYRNSAVHLLVPRAVTELAREAVVDHPPDERREEGWRVALGLRDLLKFEFFFARKRDFYEQVRDEVHALDSDPGVPLLAHLVLRPFLEAYLVVADCLVEAGPGRPPEKALLQACLGLARQWHLQRRIRSEESISLELFGTALKLARHRGLLRETAEADAGRQALRAELEEALRLLDAVERRASREATALSAAPTAS